MPDETFARPHRYELLDCTLDLDRCALLRGQKEVRLRGRSFDVLTYLVGHAKRVVGKQELMDAVWGNVVVTDDSLVQCLVEIRRALGDSSAIKTVRGRGYLLDVEVRPAEGVSTPSPASSSPGSIMPLDPTGWAALKRPVALATIAISALVLLYVVSASIRTGATEPGESVAVLPFKPLVASERDEALELGIADQIITRLGALANIEVRPTTAVRPFTALDQDAVTAGQKLHVAVVLEGTIQRSVDRIRVTVRLLRVADGRMLWSENFDRKALDIFDVQDVIAEQVAARLAARLTGTGRRQDQPTAARLEAYDLYLKGRYYWYKFPAPGYEKSREFFQRAIDVDPTYAVAFAGLADFFGYAAAQGLRDPETSWPIMEAAIQKALALDDQSAEVHNAVAGLRLYRDRDWAGAERALTHAIELNPNYAEAASHYGSLLLLRGRWEEGMSFLRRARDLDPLSLRFNRNVGRGLYIGGRYDEAIEQLRKTLEIDPSYASAHEYLGDVLERKGARAEALSAWREAIRLDGDEALVAILDSEYARAGFRGAVEAIWRERLRRLSVKSAQGEYVAPMHFVRAHARLGDTKRAYDWLEKAIGVRDRLVMDVSIDPVFESLRNSSAFPAMARSLGLPENPSR